MFDYWIMKGYRDADWNIRRNLGYINSAVLASWVARGVSSSYAKGYALRSAQRSR